MYGMDFLISSGISCLFALYSTNTSSLLEPSEDQILPLGEKADVC